MTDFIEHDRGLGTAYERVRFYELIDRWIDAYGIESALEGPFDGMAGVPGVHLVGAARRGVRVVSAVRSPEQARIVRAVYESAGAGAAAVHVADERDPLRSLPPSDLVICYHALDLVQDWRQYLASLVRIAKKLLVITVCNPSNWGVALIRATGALRGVPHLDPPAAWRTETLGPVLWELGRVREHEFFDCPWWPDLQVSPGQSLLDRARKLLIDRRDRIRFTATGQDSRLATRFVYGAGRWPYFGDGAWSDELAPALRRHPGFDRASPSVRRFTAHLHAFVLDVRGRRPRIDLETTR